MDSPCTCTIADAAGFAVMSSPGLWLVVLAIVTGVPPFLEEFLCLFVAHLQAAHPIDELVGRLVREFGTQCVDPGRLVGDEAPGGPLRTTQPLAFQLRQRPLRGVGVDP